MRFISITHPFPHSLTGWNITKINLLGPCQYMSIADIFWWTEASRCLKKNKNSSRFLIFKTTFCTKQNLRLLLGASTTSPGHRRTYFCRSGRRGRGRRWDLQRCWGSTLHTRYPETVQFILRIIQYNTEWANRSRNMGCSVF